MRSDVSRREFIAGLGLLAAAKSNLSAAPFPSSSSSEAPRLGKSPFKIAVINDEISQDFGHACEIASQKFGMEWMELRSMWNKNIAALDAQRNLGGATHPEKEQPARHRYRQSPLQGGLRRRAEIEIQPGARSIRRELYLRPAGRSSRSCHRTGQEVLHRPHPLL